MNTFIQPYKTNSQHVRDAFDQHILAKFENIEELKKQADYLIDGRSIRTNMEAGIKMAEGGLFLISNSDIKEFLNSLGINPENKEFEEAKSWTLYTRLCGIAVERLLIEKKEV